MPRKKKPKVKLTKVPPSKTRLKPKRRASPKPKRRRLSKARGQGKTDKIHITGKSGLRAKRPRPRRRTD